MDELDADLEAGSNANLSLVAIDSVDIRGRRSSEEACTALTPEVRSNSRAEITAAVKKKPI